MDHNKLENSSRDGNTRQPLPASWETCMQIKKQQLELDMEQWTGSKLGKEYVKAVYCHPAYLTYMQSISLPGEISTMICRGYHPNGRKWRGTKNPVDEGERREWKSWLKTQHSKNNDHDIWSHHFMVNRWGNSDRLFWGGGAPKSLQMVTAAMKLRHLFLARKAMTNLDSILKSTDITLPAKVLIVKVNIFQVVIYGCERWTLKKAEHQRIDGFEIWCWRDSWESLGLQGDQTSQS